MALTQQTDRFLEGKKRELASHVVTDELNSLFPRFTILIQIYNRLYKDVPKTPSKRNGDKFKATEQVLAYLAPDALAAAIEGNQVTRDAQIQLMEFIKRHTYHFELDRETNAPSDTKDDAILRQMQAPDNQTRMSGLLIAMYQVRCNFVHGEKPFDMHQLPLMQAIYPIYELVTSLTERKLRNDPRQIIQASTGN